MKTAFLLALLPALCLAEPATVIRATELRSAPATDAAVLAPLAENARVDALERKGGWTRVKEAGGSGIVQLLNVARSGTSGTQVTTGVRGLDAEELTNAKPNAAELKKMQGYAASKDGAADFAASGKLQARRVDYPRGGG